MANKRNAGAYNKNNNLDAGVYEMDASTLSGGTVGKKVRQGLGSSLGNLGRRFAFRRTK